MASSWHDLLANFAIEALVVVAWIYGRQWTALLSPRLQSVALGALLGLGSALAMMFPFSPAPGLIVDLRASPIALAGFFGGPIGGAIAGVIAGAYRLQVGGAGAVAGCIGISLSTLIGIGGHYAVRKVRVGATELAAFSTAVACGVLLSALALPAAIREAVFARAMVPTALMTLAATLVFAVAMHLENRRRELVDDNLVLRAVFRELPDCLNVKDPEGRFVLANPATARLMKAGTPEALIGKTDFDFYPSETASRFRDDEAAVLAGAKAVTIEQLAVYDDGTNAVLATLKAPLYDDHGAVIGLITHNRDVSDKKLLESELEQTRERLAGALEHMADALVMFDRQERLVLCNGHYLEMFPKTAALRIPGAGFRDILRASIELGEEDIGEIDLDIWLDRQSLRLRTAGERVIQLQADRWIKARTRLTKDGGSLIVFSDITERKQAEEVLDQVNRQLAALAATDGMTGLMNRRTFDETLANEFSRSLRDGSALSVIMVDVDRFKSFNDHYGHVAGDECLRRISRCMSMNFRRPGDMVARYGGEEFSVILPNTTPEGAYHLALELRLAVRREALVHAGSEKGIVTVSIGVASTSEIDAPTGPEELVRRADQALYAAKTAGRDRVRTAHADGAAGLRPLTDDVRAAPRGRGLA